MDGDLRKRDYKLGQIHGRLNPKKGKSEAETQRKVFLSQRITICRSRDFAKNTSIRLFGYEMPLGFRRDLCVDLVGYDRGMNLYVIELKKGASREDIVKINKQVNRYAEKVGQIKANIEKDYKEAFFYPQKFREIKKIVLAPREFYSAINWGRRDPSIEYLYFRSDDITNQKVGRNINVHVVSARHCNKS